MAAKLRDCGKHVHRHPEEDVVHANVRKLINSCKGQQLEYRVISEGTMETKENNRRLTIIVNAKKELVKTYYG